MFAVFRYFEGVIETLAKEFYIELKTKMLSFVLGIGIKYSTAPS